jgi:hypothetical protein
MGCGSILCDDPQPSCQEKVRISGNRATVENVVALFENGFGYDVAMASIPIGLAAAVVKALSGR